MGIKFSNDEKIIDEIEQHIRDAAYEGMTKATLKVEDTAKTDAPYDDGILRQSITNTVNWQNETTIKGSVGSNLEYAPYVHQGTGIYAVAGNGRKEVPWHYKDKHGNWHTTKGIKPKPFIFDAIEKNKDEIVRQVGGALSI